MTDKPPDALATLARLIEVARDPHPLTKADTAPLVEEAEELLAWLQDGSRKALDAVTLLQRLERFAEDVDADVSIGRAGYGKKSGWHVMVNYGYEAEDSPMVGASALGAEDTLEAALLHALKEARR